MARKKKNPIFRLEDKENIRWFWQTYLKSKSPWLIVVFALVSCQALVYQQFLSLTENSLNVIFDDGSPKELIKVCAIVFLLFAVRAALSYIVPRLSVWLASNAVRKMRQDLITHYLRLDLSYFEQTKSGDIILRLVNQVDGLSTFVGQGTVNAVRDAVTIIVVSGYLVYKSPILFSAAIIVIPALALIMRSVSSKIKTVQQNAESAFGDYMSGIEEMANGMRTVKISGQEERERNRLFQATDGIRDLQIRLNAAQALFEPSIDLVSAFVYVLVIGGGGYMVIQGDFGLDAAGIITFLLGLVILFDPMRLLAGFFAQLQASLVLLAGVRSVYSETPRIFNRENAVHKFNTRGDIVFDDVVFSYGPTRPFFKKLNFEILGGNTTAIVGATGSGKTTILSLISRLYDLNSGTISIGGVDIRDIDIKSLRHSFSVVAQDIVIFNDSIWNNIAYVRPDASDEEIWAAAEAAEIAGLIRERGDEELGPKGSQLSGGQKQRIAIARAFLRASPIVILDEATSALDQKTEQRIQTALGRLAEGKTVIIVAHRLSSVVNADKIYVFDNGSIVEHGNHEELIEQKGLYAGMYSSQKGSFK